MWFCDASSSPHASSWEHPSSEYVLFAHALVDTPDELMHDVPRCFPASCCHGCKSFPPAAQSRKRISQCANDQLALPHEYEDEPAIPDFAESDDDSSSVGDWGVGEEDIFLFDSLPDKLQPLTTTDPLRSSIPPFVETFREAWEARRSRYLSYDNLLWLTTMGPGVLDGGTSESEYTASTRSSSSSVVDVRPVRVEHAEARRSWACPFYRFAPAEHNECVWSLSLPSVRSVIQHIIVDHQLAHFCPLCRTTFSSATDRDLHITSRRCERREDATPPVGVSEDQVDELDAGFQRWKAMGISAEEQWFGTWNILFPGAPQPDSPYLLAAYERETIALLRFWADEGRDLISTELERRGIIRYGDLGTGTATREAFYASVLQEIL
ncbi:hypothetical protein B0T14DRAFT_521773 [Immersiella caudata]|uniref:C2H2-type domain-containing protein n=1 Tax=Immersiella caudata TaxID=314043 RepID=A0AA39WSC7_9PEZI|nr:hypothetical protein B0T14DRAFT_521773 [Immersiella caudata]